MCFAFFLVLRTCGGVSKSFQNFDLKRARLLAKRQKDIAFGSFFGVFGTSSWQGVKKKELLDLSSHLAALPLAVVSLFLLVLTAVSAAWEETREQQREIMMWQLARAVHGRSSLLTSYYSRQRRGFSVSNKDHPHRLFDKVLIANRGEISERVARTCRRLGVRTVAVYSSADAGAPFVQKADEAVCVGPPPAADSYLNAAAALEAVRATGADAVHPGCRFSWRSFWRRTFAIRSVISHRLFS